MSWLAHDERGGERSLAPGTGRVNSLGVISRPDGLYRPLVDGTESKAGRSSTRLARLRRALNQHTTFLLTLWTYATCRHAWGIPQATDEGRVFVACVNCGFRSPGVDTRRAA